LLFVSLREVNAEFISIVIAYLQTRTALTDLSPSSQEEQESGPESGETQSVLPHSKEAEKVLAPYLSLLVEKEPVYRAFYSILLPSASPQSSNPQYHLDSTTHPAHIPIYPLPPSAYLLPEIGDACSNEGGRAFWEVVRILGGGEVLSGEMWPPKEEDDE
jgi:hypothetical protein